MNFAERRRHRRLGRFNMVTAPDAARDALVPGHLRIATPRFGSNITVGGNGATVFLMDPAAASGAVDQPGRPG